MRYLYLLIIGLLAQASVSAREDYKVIRKEKEFYHRLKRSPFVVALFIALDKYNVHDQRIIQQKSDFRYVSTKRFYIDGDVQFLLIDIKRKGLTHLAHSFDLAHLPAIMLFKYDLPLKDKQGNIIALQGFSDDKAIDNFIDNNLGDAIDKYIERMAQIRQEERERLAEMQQYYGPSMYYGFGWGGYPACNYSWPYNTGYGYNCGGWGYGNYGYPSFNFGVNVPF